MPRLQAAKLYVKGHMPSLEALQQYRVALAPLRFGAGLKGKIVDSWAHGLPVTAVLSSSEVTCSNCVSLKPHSFACC